MTPVSYMTGLHSRTLQMWPQCYWEFIQRPVMAYTRVFTLMTIERDPATNWPRNVLTDQTNGSYATFVGDCLLTDITPDGILLIVGSSGLLEALNTSGIAADEMIP